MKIRITRISILFALLLFSCSDNSTLFLKDIKSQTNLLESQNKKARDNLGNLYVYFDKAKAIDPKEYELNWEKAFELHVITSDILKKIDTIKGKLENHPSESSINLHSHLSEYENKLIALPDSMNSKMVEFPLDLNEFKDGDWQHKKNEFILHDLTIIQSGIINAETVILMVLYQNLRSKEESNETATNIK